MAIPSFNSIDFNQNEAQNMRIQNLAAAPSSPVIGQIYYNTATAKLMICTNNVGPVWEELSVGSGYTHPSGFTSQPASALTGAAVISQVTVNTDGHVTGISQRDLGAADISAAPSSHVGATGAAHGVATGSVNGFMATQDKNKLDNATDAATADTLIKRDVSGRAKVVDPVSAADIATKNYVDGILAASNAMVFKGVIDASANPNYPAADAGHTYIVSVAGKVGGASGPSVEIGDMLICKTDSTATGDHATVGTNWTIIQVNLNGAVIGPASAVDGRIAVFDGITGKLVKDGGKTIGDLETLMGSYVLSSGWASQRLLKTDGTGAVVSLANGTPGQVLMVIDDLTDYPAWTTLDSGDVGLSNVENYGIATQAEAEAGALDNEYMTPLKTAYAIAALAPVKKYAASVGGSTSITVTHNLNTKDVAVATHLVASPYTEVMCEVEKDTVNSVILKFATAPSASSIRVTVIG